MTKIKFIKACPFLRDLGDSYLCVNCDKVVDVVLDPLIHIEWSDKLQPVASEIEDIETCLFTVEIKENNQLYCISRKQYLEMDGRNILWEDIRDAVILLSLDEQGEFKDTEIDFCSTCLYKVLIASSPPFQKKLAFEEKIKLGISYILNRANEIHTSFIELANKYSKNRVQSKIIKCEHSEEEVITSNASAFTWMLWLTNNPIFNDDFMASSIEWFQKYDEWSNLIAKMSESEIVEITIRNVEQTSEIASQLKDISFEMVIQLSFLKNNDIQENPMVKYAEKIFSIASIHFEDFIFIANQFLDIVKNS